MTSSVMVKRSKNQLRREKAKQRKKDGEKENIDIKESHKQVDDHIVENNNIKDNKQQPDDSATTEPMPSPMEDITNNPLFHEYQQVFQRFNDEDEDKDKDDVGESNQQLVVSDKKELQDSGSNESSDVEYDINDGENDNDNTKEAKSKRKTKKENKIPIAKLKTMTSRPQMVEWFDADAPDPYLLVSIKTKPNIVPVPGHWLAKRDYLSSRRGIERPPFKLPKFILDTGIQDMRDSTDDLSLRQQQRERIQPKMGKLDIDYQRLHDAFFQNQSKTSLLGMGDVYFEGRESNDEFHPDLSRIKPGRLSKDLLSALGLPEDAKTPPPWIASMKQLGKPPAYSNMIIPGIDIPYSNVGYLTKEDDDGVYLNGSSDDIDTLWGKFETIEDSDDESDDDDEEEEEEDDENEERYPSDHEETPAFIDEINYINSASDEPKPSSGLKPNKLDKDKKLYTVIGETSAPTGEGLVNTDFGYQLDESSKETSKPPQSSSSSSTRNNDSDTSKKKFKF